MWHPSSNTGIQGMPNVHSHCIGAAFGNLMIQTLNAPRLAEPTFRVEIKELDLYHPPTISWGHEDWFYVDVDIDGRVQTTSIVGKHELPWKETFTFDARQSSVITLRVFAQRKLHKDRYVGSVQGRLDAFLGSSGKAVLHDVSPPHSNNDHHHTATRTRLSFSVKRVEEVVEPGFPRVPSPPPTKEEILPVTEHHRPKEDSWKNKGGVRDQPATKEPEMDPGHSSSKILQAKASARNLVPQFAAIVALFPNDGQIQQILDSANTFSPLLDKINIFLTFTDALGDIHPYVKMAAVVLTGVVKVFTSQMVFKNNVKNLVETMTDAHSFLSESDPLSKIQSHLQIIRALSAQTVECSYFLRDIMKGGLGCFVSQQLLVTNTERKFQDYTQKFQQLRAALQERAIISTAVNVLRLYDEVQGISAQISLDNMYYAEDVHYTNVDECDSLEPDQRELSDEIACWINGDSTERIFYVCGPAECGKTAVAREVAHLFDGLQRLGSSYFVRESQKPAHQHYLSHHKDPRDPSCIFRNISRDIADHNPHFKQAVGEKVKKCAIRTTNRVRTQFQELILEPAKHVSWCGPVVIVIDALDVCGEGHQRKDLLNVLATKAAELPPNFRILITSRPEADIVHAFKDKSHVMMKILEDATLPDNDSGISFSPVTTSCGRRSPSPSGDSVLESDYLEDRGDLTEFNDVYRSYEFSDEQDIHPYDGDTSPPPPYVHEDATPGDQTHTPVLHTREQTDITSHSTGGSLRRGHTLHFHDGRNGLKSAGAKVYRAVHGHHVDGDVRYRDHPGELVETEHLEESMDGYTRKSSAQTTTLRRVKSDRFPVVDTLNRQCRRPVHRSRLIVAHEAIHL
ncbi:hypothetical protein F5J12DRAFT_491178 [Pisolithus orientalis]|uniref:uncharacterized protein n=1 Tax=Pisolithus orientalis TaxID=936130 RepID=UPI002225A03D|nr:uncharacterized protein F5J12DRAFT_491178 [Pisolithus orientalis]KAI6019863.1 hypothetical protein F5J12DRAFT_491178 [Pisolithus orientalis]